MTFQQIYDQWGRQDDSKVLYAKTKSAFKAVWAKLNWNQPCSALTLKVLGEAFRQTKAMPGDKVKSASVMVHVLKYAHDIDPKENPRPAFHYNDITAYGKEEEKPKSVKKVLNAPQIAQNLPKLEQKLPETVQKLPDMEPKKKARTTKKKPDMSQETDTIGRSKNRKKRRVAQIDPSTLQVVKIWPSMGQAESTLKIRNVTRAIEKHRCAGGFFWCDEKDLGTFIPKGHTKPVLAPANHGDCPNDSSETEIRGTVPCDSPSVADLPPLAEKLNPGHGQPQPGKTSPDEEDTEISLTDCHDKALIEELINRGWHGEIRTVNGKMTVKVEF